MLKRCTVQNLKTIQYVNVLYSHLISQISITNYGAQGRLNFVFLNPKRRICRENQLRARGTFFFAYKNQFQKYRPTEGKST